MTTFNEWTTQYHKKGIDWIEHEMMVLKLAYENALEIEKHVAKQDKVSNERWNWINE